MLPTPEAPPLFMPPAAPRLVPYPIVPQTAHVFGVYGQEQLLAAPTGLPDAAQNNNRVPQCQINVNNDPFRTTAIVATFFGVNNHCGQNFDDNDFVDDE